MLARTIINNPAGTATLTGPSGSNGGYIAVLPSATSIAAAPQGGTGSTIDNGDNRNSSMIYRVGDLIYMARAVNASDGSGRSVARWTVLSVNNSTNAISVVKEGTIDLGATGSLHAFYPSIAANTRGDFVMSFSRSGSTEFPSIWAVVGTTTDHQNWSVGNPSSSRPVRPSRRVAEPAVAGATIAPRPATHPTPVPSGSPTSTCTMSTLMVLAGLPPTRTGPRRWSR